MRLHTKIILLIVAVTLGAGLGSALLVSRMMHDALDSEMRDQAVLAVQCLAEHVTRHVIDGEVVEAREAVGKMVERSQSIQYAYIIDFDGRLFAHTFEGGFPEALAAETFQHDPVSAQSPIIVHLVTGTGRILDVGYPLIDGMAAHVHIGMDEEHTHTRVASLRNGIIGLSLLLAGAGIAMGAFVSRRMTRPLSDLAGVMRDFGTRKMEEEVEFRGGGREMAHLTRAFNQMISGRKRAAEALRESEERCRRVVQDMPVLICRFLPGGEITFVNKAYCEYFARTPEELVGSAFLSLIPESDRETVMANILALTVESPAQSHEHPVLVPGGDIRWQRWTNRALFDVRGKVVAYQSIGEDITERKRAEAEIARLATVVEQAAVTVVITDLEGDIVYANPDFETSTGYSVAEASGQNPRVLKSDCQDASFYQELWDTITAGRTWNGVFVNKRKDERLYHEEATIFPIKDAAGEIINYAAVKRDVTERVRAEEALRESEKQLQTLIDAMPDFVCFKDGDGCWLKVNDAGIRIFQIEGMDYRGKKDSELAELDSNLRGTFLTCKETDARVWKDGGLVHGEETVPDSDGSVRVYDVIKVPVFHPDGERKGLVIIGHDITERKQAEAEREQLLTQIHQQAKQMQQTIDTVPEGVLLLDTAHRVILANPVAEGDLAVLVGRDAISTYEPLTCLGDRPLAELLTSPPTKGLWHEVKTDGRTFEVIARPMENGPEPENWVLVIRDVTQEREIERRVQQQERLAAVGQLAAGVAHDFNNIMATIVLYTKMSLSAPDLPPQIRQCLETVSGQAYRATDLIQQILDFSRRAVMERRPMDLMPFLKEVVNLLERTVPESIEIEFTCGTGEYTVHADPTRMQQAIMNLAVNARDAMPEGGELRIELERVQVESHKEPPLPEMEAGEWVRVRVSDTGSGIPPDVLPHIFEPFFTTKEVGQGTGLGLAQVYGIVKQHEGHIGVSTEVGAGTTFTLYLPALLSSPPEAPAMKTVVLVQGQGETVLVVEDDATLRQALVSTLQLLNYRVLEAANGREALDTLEGHAGDPSAGSGQGVSLVLSDLVMPEMGGQALFHAMRQRGLSLPVVMLSGHPLESELEDLQAQGMAGWLLKPPGLEQLAQLLARALGRDAE